MAEKQMTADAADRVRALNPKQSFIVQAPAGSGKTALLIQRFLTLLNTVTKPEEILAITFTKKAASEMRLRIIKALKEAEIDLLIHSTYEKATRKLAKQVLQRDQQFNWQLISNPNQLRIQTIDSFCCYLTKQLPLLSHFGAPPHLTDQPKRLYSEAVQEIVGHVEENYAWSNAIAMLLTHLDNDLTKLHDLLVTLLAKRDQWLPYIQLDQSPDNIRQQLQAQLAAVISEHLHHLHYLFDKTIDHSTAFSTETFLSLLRFAAGHLSASDKSANQYMLACKDLSALPAATADGLTAWRGIASFLLTQSGEWRKRLDTSIGFPALSSIKNKNEKHLHEHYRQQYQQCITILSTHEKLHLALKNLITLPDGHYTDEQWEILQALLLVLKMAAAQLRLSFIQHGQIDFIENAQAAIQALGDEQQLTDLALALDYQIKHILVDEFQDTSTTQYLLLKKLTSGWESTDGRTLFVVGDPMQSIYRFREAEVGLFIRMRNKGLGQLTLTPLTLSANFRSTEKIIHWNNIHFESIFPKQSDMTTGAVSYSASTRITETSNAHSSSENDITIQQVNSNDEEATQITDYITATLAAYPSENIAILVRSRMHLVDIIPTLKKANISYHAVDIDPLASRQSIQDLLSLTCAYLHPYDHIAWLAVLRAPWCGISLADALIITQGRLNVPIVEQLSKPDIMAALSDDGKNRINKLYRLIKMSLHDRGRYSLASNIKKLWLLLGGPACLQDPLELQDTQAFFDLLMHMEEQQMIISSEKVKEKVNCLYASHQEEEARVQIMTIYTAKGLEFDTVILPHLEKQPPNEDKDLLVWMEQPLSNEQTALLLAPIHAATEKKEALYAYIKNKQRIKLQYETDRLFYVATTRAKKRLFVSYQLKQDNDKIKLANGSFLEKIYPLINKQSIHHQPNDINLMERTSTPRYLRRLTTDWRNPVSAVRSTNSVAHMNRHGFILPDHTAKKIGTLSHRLLQILSHQGSDWWTTQSQEVREHYLCYHLKQMGVITAIQPAIDTIMQLIKNVLDDKRGQWILHKHEAAQSEWRLTVFINQQPQQLIIDRTFIDDDGIRWIIDYKTTTFSSEDRDTFLAKEYAKHKEKMQMYANALHLLDNHTIRLGLYFPAIPAWYEWEPVNQDINQGTIALQD